MSDPETSSPAAPAAEAPSPPAEATPAASAAKAPEVVELEPGPAEPPPPPPARHRDHPSEPPAPLSVHAGMPPRKWPPEVIGDLMTRQLIAVDETEPLGDLEGGMQRFRFRHLPVVSSGKKLVGLITRSDFLHAMLGATPDGKPTLEKVDARTPAAVIMRQRIITAKVDTPITTALQVMLDEKLTCLPVVLEDATLVGIVTESDFARLALELLQRKAH